jgi:hypothetical protein
MVVRMDTLGRFSRLGRGAGAIAHLLAAAALVLCSAGWARADASQVYDGMTLRQLAEFAGRQGWRAEVGAGMNLTVHADGQRAHVTMLDCDQDGRCKAGVIRNMSYYFIKTPRGACDLWHWNLDSRGATGFGPNYVSLQRYLQFRGVTEQYLRDAFLAWLGASPSFWKLVEECYDQERDVQRKDSRQ